MDRRKIKYGYYGVIVFLCFMVIAFFKFVHDSGMKSISLEAAAKDGFTEGQVFVQGEIDLQRSSDDEIRPIFAETMLFRVIRKDADDRLLLIGEEVSTGTQKELCWLEENNGFYTAGHMSEDCLYLEYQNMKAGKAVSITVYRYQVEDGAIRKLGTIPNYWAGQYGVYKDEIYRFTGFEGCTLEKWNSKNGADTVLDHVYGEIGSLKIHDGIIGMQDEKRNYLIRYDIKTQKILDQVKLDKTVLPSYVQANENYAVWIGETGQVFVYCYRTEELLALCNVTEMEEKVLLFDDRLYVINGEKMWGYDLKNRKMEVKRIVC